MWDKDTIKNEFEKVKYEAKMKAIEALEWVAENPELALGIGAIGTKVLWEAGRYAKRRQVDRIERERRARVWDPEVGTRWQLKREMTNREAREYADRVRCGETRYDVLYDMGLLKRR